MSKIKKDVSESDLRKFGLILGTIIIILIGLILPLIRNHQFRVWPFATGGVLYAWSVALPLSLKPFYTGWVKVGRIIGKINSTVLLSIVFFLLITPFGIVMRFFSYDPLKRKYESGAVTYRKKSIAADVDRMEVPY